MDLNKKERVPTRKWSHDETTKILEHFVGLIQQDLELEKPTAKVFYGKVLKELNIKNASDIQLKSKMKLLRKQYSIALEWEKNTGQGVEKGSIKDHLLKICPYYDLLESIYGSKTNINPPFVYDSQSSASNFNFEEIIEFDNSLDLVVDSLYTEEFELETITTMPSSSFVDLTGSSSSTIENQNQSTSGAEKENQNQSTSGAEKENQNQSTSGAEKENQNQSTSGAEKENEETVRMFSQYLRNTPSSSKKRKINSRDVISDIHKQRILAMEAKNKIEEKRIDFEAKLKREEINIAKEKLDFEKEIRTKELELQLKQCESRENIEKMKIEERITIEKMRLEYNYKLELAKYKNTTP